MANFIKQIKQPRTLGQCAGLQTLEKTRFRSEGELLISQAQIDQCSGNSRGFGTRLILIDHSPTHVTNAQIESLRFIRVHSVIALYERTSLLSHEM